MRVHRAIAEELVAQGVRRAFCLLGEDVAKPMVAARELGVEIVSFRHENQAVAAADAYARTTGEVGVVALAGGPGFTNALTALNTAHRYGSRVVLLVGGDQGGAKHVPHPDVCRAMGMACLRPGGPEDVVRTLGEALDTARNDRLVVLDVPLAHLEETLEWPAERHEPAVREPVAPDPADVARLADLLQESWAVQRPVVLAGWGAMRADAVGALRGLAERIGALTATTIRAHGAFVDEPFDLGICGTYATPEAVDLLRGADCVLAFGASLNRFTTYDGQLFPKARVVQVDADPEALGRDHEVDGDLSLVGDARLVAEALTAELDRRGVRTAGQRTDAVEARLAAVDPRRDHDDRSGDGLVDPRTVALRLDEVLDPDRLVVIDGAHSSAFAVANLRIASPRRFVQTSYVGGAGAIGLSLGAAIGAAVGNPGVPVVDWAGDAAHLMALADLDTAVRERLPLLVLVCNDEALGAEVKFLELTGQPTDLARIPTPALADVATALGAEGRTVRTLADLEELVERLASPLDGPLVVDCRVNPDVRADWVDFLWASQAALQA